MRRLGVLPLLGLLVLVWAPALHTPFRFDDTFFFDVRTVGGQSFLEHARTVLDASFDSGRVMPASVLTSMVPWVFSDARGPYKLWLLIFSAVVLVLVAVLLRRLGVSAIASGLSVLLAATFMQFRFYHDSLLGYSGLMQLSTLLLVLAALAWLRYDQGGRAGWFAASLVLWLSCLTLYEVNAALLPALLAVVVIRRRTLRRSLRSAVGFAVPTVLVLGTALFVRSSGAAPPGYEPSFSPVDFLSAMVRTVIAAVPTTYAVFDPSGLMQKFTTPELAAGAWRGVLATVAGAVLLQHATTRETWSVRPLVWLGAALWIFPSTLLALAPKYQNEIVLGQAYLPVFVQVIGITMLFVAAGVTLARVATDRGPRTGLGAVAAVALVLGACAAITGTANLREVAIEQAHLRTDEIFDEAVSAGVLNSLPGGSSIVARARDLNWFPYAYAVSKKPYDGAVRWRTGREYDMRVDQTALVADCPLEGDAPRPSCAPLDQTGGWLAVRVSLAGDVAVLAVSPTGSRRGGGSARPGSHRLRRPGSWRLAARPHGGRCGRAALGIERLRGAVAARAANRRRGSVVHRSAGRGVPADGRQPGRPA